jgi:MFS family permease
MGIGFFMSAAAAGGAITQWPLGKWSDRTDRRRVIVVACLAAACAAGALVFADASAETVMLLLAFLFGACALPLYALCVAQTNDRAPAHLFVEVSGDLLFVFGIGAILGPFLAALLMTAIGHIGIFIFTGRCTWGLLALRSCAFGNSRRYALQKKPPLLP